MGTDDIFQYDPKWPSSNVRKTFDLFTRKEDALILDYLIKTKQYEKLGGNVVWKTLSHSKTFNPRGRSFHGLRERFLKHILKHLHLYSQVTPQIRARFLQQNPKNIKNINSMKSTDELKRDLQPTFSSDSEDEIHSENSPVNVSMTPVLRERSLMLQQLKSSDRSSTFMYTSTPLVPVPSSLNSAPSESVAETSGDSKTLLALPEPGRQDQGDNSLIFSSSTASNRSVALDPNTERQLVVAGGSKSALKLYFDRGLDISFKELKSLEEHKDVRDALQLLQDSLRGVLKAHGEEISLLSFFCRKDGCDGTQVYLELWRDLAQYLSKVETFEYRFDRFYLNQMKMVMEEIVETPLCVKDPSKEIPKFRFKGEDLFEYLCCDLAKPFRKNVKKVLVILESIEKKSWK